MIISICWCVRGFCLIEITFDIKYIFKGKLRGHDRQRFTTEETLLRGKQPGVWRCKSYQVRVLRQKLHQNQNKHSSLRQNKILEFKRNSWRKSSFKFRKHATRHNSAWCRGQHFSLQTRGYQGLEWRRLLGIIRWDFRSCQEIDFPASDFKAKLNLPEFSPNEEATTKNLSTSDSKRRSFSSAKALRRIFQPQEEAFGKNQEGQFFWWSTGFPSQKGLISLFQTKTDMFRSHFLGTFTAFSCVCHERQTKNSFKSLKSFETIFHSNYFHFYIFTGVKH